MRYPGTYTERVRKSVEASIATKQHLLRSASLLASIGAVAETVIDALQRGNKAILFGNGGSAADAQHIAAEFVGRFAFDRPALAALALTANSSCVTAIGNDYGFDVVFARQLQAVGRAGDVAIAISTSGNSPNVLCAVAAATDIGLRTVALTGESGGKLKSAVDCCICVPASETPRIQECHILIGHIVAELVEEAMFPQERTARHAAATGTAQSLPTQPALIATAKVATSAAND